LTLPPTAGRPGPDQRRRELSSCSAVRLVNHHHDLKLEICYGKQEDDWFRERIMSLIAYYVAFMVVGDFVAYFLGLLTEYEWGPHASLIVFLALYFLFLWVSWVLAVQVTKLRTP
jgi:hypothetical protein